MNDFLFLALALVAGLLLGTIFFGGLWWTVRKGISSKSPALWFLGACCCGWALCCLDFILSAADWQRLVACLLGFVLARFIVTRLTRPPVEHPNAPVQEARHAP